MLLAIKKLYELYSKFNMEVILNNGDGILLVLPDVSAVLDILDYTMLLNCLYKRYSKDCWQS